MTDPRRRLAILLCSPVPGERPSAFRGLSAGAQRELWHVLTTMPLSEVEARRVYIRDNHRMVRREAAKAIRP